MCIGSMTLQSDAAIPGSVTARRAQLPSEDPVRTTQTSSVPASSTRTATGSGPSGVSGGGRNLVVGGGVSSSNLLIPDDDGRIDGGDGDINDRDGGGTKRKIFPGEDDEGGTGGGGLTGGGGGTGGEDDDRIVDDEGDETDDTKDKREKREEEEDEEKKEEGPTTSPARIVSPLIRAVQGERPINRRGRNSLFIKQGKRTGAHRVRDKIVDSSSLRPPQLFVSPIESGLIPLRR